MMLKRILNKRGEESSGPGPIIVAVIAAFVLVIVIVGLILWFKGNGSFFSFLPNFNQTKPSVSDLEIFGYKYTDNALRFHDGLRWNDFQGVGTFNGKEVNAGEMRSAFYGVFFGAQYLLGDPKTKIDPNILKLPSDIDEFYFCLVEEAKKIPRSWRGVWLFDPGYGDTFAGAFECREIRYNQDVQFRAGDIIVGYKGKDYVVASLDNKVYALSFGKYDAAKGEQKEYTSKTVLNDAALSNRISSLTISLRDYSLNLPLPIKYVISGTTVYDKYCIQRRDDYYSIDLSQPTTSLRCTL